MALTIAVPGRPYPAAGQRLLAALRSAHDTEAGLTAIRFRTGQVDRLSRGWDGAAAPAGRPRVFISYAHAPASHKADANRLAELLIAAGVDVRIDTRYDRQPRDWALWIVQELGAADYVLVIASPEYRRRAEGAAGGLEGRGVAFEAYLMRDELYPDPARARHRFLPVLLPGMSQGDIPRFLGPNTGTYVRVSSLTRTGVAPLLAMLNRGPVPPRMW